MAQELTINGNIRFQKNSVDSGQIVFANNTKFTVTGTRMVHSVQQIGTSKELLQLAEMSNIGYLLLINRDATNFVEVFTDATTGPSVAKLLAGQLALIPANGDLATPAAKADTAQCALEIFMVEI